VSSEAALVSTPQSDPAKSKPSQKEKELAKLNSRKREIEVKLVTIQSEIRELVGQTGSQPVKSDIDSTRGSMLSVESDAKKEEESGSSATTTKEAAQNQKRIDHLARTESKLLARLNKIEAQQLKVIRKLEAHQRKAADRDEKTRSRSEVDSLKKEISSLRKEVRELRAERTEWLDIVGRLQKENTSLIAQMEKSGQGGNVSGDGAK
jgi:chromosome segregation ATPase